jgi:type IV pilus assembly protein PilQ
VRWGHNGEVTVAFSRKWIATIILISIFFPNHSSLAQPSKISLDFKDADVRNILKLIAEVSELNMIIGDEVKGRMTLKLVDVPIDQALEVILQSQSLGMVRNGNVIRVVFLEKLRKEEETQLASKRSKEKAKDLRTELVRLNYAIAKDMIPAVKMFLSERGSVIADERTNTLIIRDAPENIETIKNLFR